MSNIITSAGTEAQQSDAAEVSTSSQPCSNTFVSGSVLTANVPLRFAEAVKELHTAYNVELKQYKDYKNDWITVVVQGSMDDLKKLNKECSEIAYKYLD